MTCWVSPRWGCRLTQASFLGKEVPSSWNTTATKNNYRHLLSATSLRKLCVHTGTQNRPWPQGTDHLEWERRKVWKEELLWWSLCIQAEDSEGARVWGMNHTQTGSSRKASLRNWHLRHEPRDEETRHTVGRGLRGGRRERRGPEKTHRFGGFDEHFALP